MPAPATADDFLTIVERSGLIEPDDLDVYRLRAAADPAPPKALADWMLADKALTAFQAGMLLEGKTRPFFVGAYKVLARIGHGSMGQVYLCEHLDMRRKVAVKVLQARRARDGVALQRFEREARAAAALDHPNVVHALDVGTEGDLHFLVMEHVDGSSLKELVVAEGPLAPRRAAEYLRQAAKGLGHAHAAGLIHRDVKPSNLMVDRNGQVKLLDLGLARFADGDEELTRGVLLGSAAYIAPEQALDSHTVDHRADVYSLGATFYLAATGRPPTPGAGIPAETKPPKGTDPADFARLLAILRKMADPDREKRYQTAAEVVAEVTAWVPPASGVRVPTPAPAPDPSEPAVELEPAEEELAFTPGRRGKEPVPGAPTRSGRWRWAAAVGAGLAVAGALAVVARGDRAGDGKAGPPKLAPRPVSPHSP
jgi:serine/threonine protein kinase